MQNGAVQKLKESRHDDEHFLDQTINQPLQAG
jgi:hypothetical protein